MEPVKTCSMCGQRITRQQWQQLPRLGAVTGPTDDTVVELRNHGCGTTLGLEVAANG